MTRIFLITIFILTAAIQVTAETQTIHCPKEPPTVRRLQLNEQWRIDSDDEDAPVLGYFYPNQILAHDGRVYLLDTQMRHVLIYSDGGEFLGTILREGDGPGEIRQPGAMFLRPNGQIAVQHGYPTKVEFVDLDGTPRGQWQVGCNTWLNTIQETPRGWFGVYRESRFGDDFSSIASIFHVAIHDDEGQITEEYFREEKEKQVGAGDTSNEAKEYIGWLTAVALEDGLVVHAAARNQYRLEWQNLSGEVTRIVTRDFTAHKRTEAELEKLKYTNYSISPDGLVFQKRELCSDDPMIKSLEQQADGSLRVRTSLFEKDMPPGMVCRYEVHEATGALRERVEIYDPSGDFDIDYDIITILEDGRAMVLRNVRPTSRTAIDPMLHPDLVAKRGPIPDDRQDIAFTPVMYDLVPYSEDPESTH